ncbi:NRK, partial [Cervus elaphus hippelaphus]
LLMRVPRERIKIAFRLWIPILVLRIVVAETEAWPQALGLSALGLASINIIILPDSLGIGMMLTFNAEALSVEANEQLFKKILDLFFTSILRNHHSRVYFMTLGTLEELQSSY